MNDPLLQDALAQAARDLLVHLKAHRVAGDSELEAALAKVKGILAAHDALPK